MLIQNLAEGLKENEKIIEGREVIFKALVGSHNYNLNTKMSDKDYKYFVCPTFDDLYDNKQFSSYHIGIKQDYTVADIRNLPKYFFKSNINFLEILESKEFIYNPKFFKVIDYMYNNNIKLETMNIHGLYKACIGMSFTKQNNMVKMSPARAEALEKFGYDPKSACHAYRVLDFLERFSITNNFFAAMHYDQEEIARQLLLNLKNGKFPLSEVKFMIEEKRKKVFTLENDFSVVEEKTDVYRKFVDVVKEVIKKEISRRSNK